MKALTTIKTTPMGTLAIYNLDGDIIATSEKQNDGRYIICIVGGIAHGKITFAENFDHLNVKSTEIAKLH
jgi:pantothenate kinase